MQFTIFKNNIKVFIWFEVSEHIIEFEGNLVSKYYREDLRNSNRFLIFSNRIQSS